MSECLLKIIVKSKDMQQFYEAQREVQTKLNQLKETNGINPQ